MRVRGWTVLAVVSGGVALGTMLGTAANPVPKQAVEQARQGALQASADAGSGIVDAGPPNQSPYPDSYAPSWANEEIANWDPAYPAWSYSDFGSDSDEAQPAPSASEQPVAVDSTAPAPPATSPPPADPAALMPERRVAGTLGALY